MNFYTLGHGGSDGLHGYVPSLDHVVADTVSLYNLFISYFFFITIFDFINLYFYLFLGVFLGEDKGRSPGDTLLSLWAFNRWSCGFKGNKTTILDNIV